MSFKNHDFYEQLLHNKGLVVGCKRGSKKCTATWWKVFVMVGVTLLVVGVCFVLYGYLSPLKAAPMYQNHESGIILLDRHFIVQNRELDIYKLIGLICFCIGGLTMALALMIPSFLYRYMEDEDDDLMFEDNRHFVKEYSSNECPTSDSKIPLNRHLSEVQPQSIVGEIDMDEEYTED